MIEISKGGTVLKDEQDDENLVKTLCSDLKEGVNFVTEVDEAFIVLGDPKHGKSTLTNYLCGVKLKCQRKKNKKMSSEFAITFVEPDTGLDIGNNLLSQTAKPQLLQDRSDEKVIYWDSPGFYDTKGIRQQIMNGFYIQKVFEKTKNPKIILVASYSSFDADQAENLIKIMQKLGKIFSDLETAKKSTCLVFTKVPYCQDQKIIVEDLRQYLKGYINDTKQILIKKPLTEHLLNYFSTDGHIQIFYQPQIGEISPQNSIKIKQKLTKVQPASQQKIQVISIIISDRAKNIMSKIANDMNQKVRQTCQNLNKQFLKTLKIILSDISIKNFESAKQKIKSLLSNIRQIRQSKDQQKFMKELSNLFIQKSSNYSELVDFIQILVFTQSVNKNIVLALSSWQNQFSKTEEFLSTLLKDPLYKQINGCLEIKAHIIGFSTINEIFKNVIKGNVMNISKLRVFSSCFLYLDDKIVLPGASVAMLSKNWISNGEQGGQLILKGKDADNFQNRAQDGIEYEEDGTGKNGNDGRPGQNGQNGGIFYGKIMSETKNKQIKLKLNLCGGKGGDGQDGGKGVDGKPLDIQKIDQQNLKRIEKIQEEFLIERDFYKWDEASLLQKGQKVLKALTTFNEQFKQVYKIEGQKGHKGGDGGRGGIGGKSGNKGIGKLFIKLNQVLDQVQIKVQKHIQQCGENGNPGLSGKGSQNSSTVLGIYLNQKIFSVFRPDSTIKKQQQILVPESILVPEQIQNSENNTNFNQSPIQKTQQLEKIQPETVLLQKTQSEREQQQLLKSDKSENLNIQLQNFQQLNQSRVSYKKKWRIVQEGYKLYHGGRNLFSGAVNAGSGLAALKILKAGTAASFIVPAIVGGVITAVSAGVSNRWIQKPTLTPGQFADDGISPSELNKQEEQNPQSIQYFTEQDLASFEITFNNLDQFPYLQDGQKKLDQIQLIRNYF